MMDIKLMVFPLLNILILFLSGSMLNSHLQRIIFYGAWYSSRQNTIDIEQTDPMAGPSGEFLQLYAQLKKLLLCTDFLNQDVHIVQL
jgi:hypothetical protein